MRMFSISIEDRILRTKVGEGGPGDGPSSRDTTAGKDESRKNEELYEFLVNSNAEAAKMNDLLKERAKLLNESLEALRSETDLQNRIATNLLSQMKTEEELEDLKKGASEERIKALDAQIAQAQKFNKLRKELMEASDEEIKKGKQLEENKMRLFSEEEKAIRRLLKIKIDGQTTLNAVLDSAEATEQDKKDALEKAKGINKEFLTFQEKTSKVSQKVAKNLKLSSKFSDTFLGSAVDLKKRYKQLSATIGDKGIKSAMKSIAFESFNFKNIAGSIVDETFKIAVNIEKVSKDLGKATGFGSIFDRQVRDIANNLSLLGGDENSAGEVLRAMNDSLSSFNPEAAKTNKMVGATMGKLQLLGVSAASAAKSIDLMQRTMGMSAEQAAESTAQIARMGKEIGISGTKMIEQFNAASGRLAIYGSNNIKVFKELAAQAKATGIEMNTLLSISKKFDQFDSAAESAAQLNAVLGTQLSTIEMLNATDSERILMIKQQVQASVGNFDSLDKFTKQYVAQAMGVSDVAEAQRLLNMSMSEYQGYKQGQQEAADIQKEMAEATAELVPVMQKLGLVMMKIFRIFTPLINGFLLIGDAIDWVYSKFAGASEGFSSFVGTIGTILKYVGMAIGVYLLGPISGVTAAIMGLVTVFGAIYDILHLPGSLSMAEGMFDKTIGPAMDSMGKDALKAKANIGELNSEMQNAYDAAHPDGNVMDIQAAASIDTNAIAAGITKVKSALMELSTLKIDGFLAMTTDGTNSSFIMGSEGMIKNISEGKLVVDVKMPEMKMPDVHVKVYIGNTELREIIRTEAKAVVGGAG